MRRPPRGGPRASHKAVKPRAFHDDFKIIMDAGPHRSADLGFARAETSAGSMRMSEVLAGLSYALDLTEGQRPGHSVRSCLIGMRLGGEVGLTSDQLSSLFYALLMKDLGCSSNAARFAALFGQNDHDLKSDLKIVNWSKAIESFRFVARNAAPGKSAPSPHLARARSDGTRPRRRTRSGAHALRARRRHRAAAGAFAGDRERDPRARRALGRARPALRNQGARHPAPGTRPRPGANRRSVLQHVRRGDGVRHGRGAARNLVRSESRRCALLVSRGPHVLAGRGQRRQPAGSQVHRAQRPRASRHAREARSRRGSIRPRHRREVSVDISAFQRRRRDRGVDRTNAGLPGDGAARPAASRAPSRPRQARRLQPDPGQARKAHRYGAAGDAPPPGVHRADSRASGMLLPPRGDGRVASREARWTRLPSPAALAAGSRATRACCASPTSAMRCAALAPTGRE